MAPTNFRLSVGSLVSVSLGITFKNLPAFILLTAVVLSPWIALILLVEPTVENAWVVPVGQILQALLGFVLTGALTYGVVQQLRGQRASIAGSLNMGMKSFFRVLGTSLLCGIRIFLFTLLLIIPGIIEAIRLFVAIPAAVMEGKGGGASVVRSITLTDGSRWPIFGAWLLLYVAGILLAGILGGALGASGMLEDPRWIDIGVALLVTPFAATIGSTCYFLLRKGKENVDAAQIAAVFD